MGRMGGQMFPNNYKRRAVDGDGEKGAGEEGVELGDEGGEEGGGAGGGQEEGPLGQPHRSPDPADRRRAGAKGGGSDGREIGVVGGSTVGERWLNGGVKREGPERGLCCGFGWFQ